MRRIVGRNELYEFRNGSVTRLQGGDKFLAGTRITRSGLQSAVKKASPGRCWAGGRESKRGKSTVGKRNAAAISESRRRPKCGGALSIAPQPPSLILPIKGQRIRGALGGLSHQLGFNGWN